MPVASMQHESQNDAGAPDCLVKSTQLPQGILLINKPRGMTSFGVVARVRKLAGQKRVGHTGTLDPFADGLLIVCIGRATQMVQFMEHYDKMYRVGIAFGRSTDTQDLTGQTLTEHVLTETEKDQLRSSGFSALHAAVAQMIGDQQQVPPMYSALKVDGKPLYVYARKGETLERKSRAVRIDEAVLESIELGDILTATLRIRCSKGTYIRTLADDLGRKLGYGAYAYSLTRLSCGPFALDQAHELDDLFDLQRASSSQTVFISQIQERGYLLPMSSALAAFPRVDLGEREALDLINGRPLCFQADDPERRRWADIPAAQTLAFYCREHLVAAGHLEHSEAGVRRVRTERVLIDLADFRQN